MIRRALIVYCDSTKSGYLPGTLKDNENFREYLQSSLGGQWRSDEILSCRNPTENDLIGIQQQFMYGADYTFVLYSGHGAMGVRDRNQYIELRDTTVSYNILDTGAARQTLVIDACRNFTTTLPRVLQGFEDEWSNFLGEESTRHIFDNAVMSSPPGYAILCASSPNQSSLDTNQGGVYSLSLLQSAEHFKRNVPNYNIMNVTGAHRMASSIVRQYIRRQSKANQIPKMYRKHRAVKFPFAVKV